MISKLFRRRAASVEKPSASVPPGRLIYAVGDIHGRADLLHDLLAQIDADRQSRTAEHVTIIFLGDLIDRGPQSAQVVDFLSGFAPDATEVLFILGNHEEVLLRSLQGERSALSLFNRIGGRETALSYGIPEQTYRDCDYDQLVELLCNAVPQEHIDFLSGFEDLIVIGDYAFVHAGVRPGEPLARQRISDLRWIRSDFLSHDGPLEKTIVHGHTIADEVEITPNRIGIDTGAFASGKLSAIGLQDDRRWILQTDGERPARAS